MGTMVSQITRLTIVYSTVYSGADQRKHQSSASLAFVWGIHRGPVNSPHKGPVTRKMFPFDDVIMIFRDLDNVEKWAYKSSVRPCLWRGLYTAMPIICPWCLFPAGGSARDLHLPCWYHYVVFWDKSAHKTCWNEEQGLSSFVASLLRQNEQQMATTMTVTTPTT